MGIGIAAKGLMLRENKGVFLEVYNSDRCSLSWKARHKPISTLSLGTGRMLSALLLELAKPSEIEN